jgi:hypothetical protein
LVTLGKSVLKNNLKQIYNYSKKDHILIKFLVIIIGVMSLVYVSVLHQSWLLFNYYTEFNFFYIQGARDTRVVDG